MKSSNHTVLFICLGNICRSPAAEGIMKAKVEEKGLASQFYIDSAAIGPWHVGQLPGQSYAPLWCRSWLLF
jgi:protein-tyrosine phosphatase